MAMNSTACYHFLPFPSPFSFFPSPNHMTRFPLAASTKQLSTSKSVTYALDPKTDGDHQLTSFQDYQSLFVSQRSETKESISLELVEGAIPCDFPNGTYYLAGPGIFTDDHGSTVNPLDGHGYLRAFRFANGSVSYSARYVKTEAQREERDERTGEWRFVYRGPFSVLRGGNMFGNMKVMKNVANTSVGVWGGLLLCFWEGGDPHEIDPVLLDTVGQLDLFVDHNRHYDGDDTGGLYKMGMDLVGMLLKPVLHEFDSDFKVVQKKEFCIPDHLLIHDWCFTDNHYIIVGNRIKIDEFGSLLAVMGHSPMISTLAVNSEQPTSPVYLLPRFSDRTGRGDGRSRRRRDWRKPIQLPKKMWVIHVGNGFEEKDGSGNVVIQFVAAASSYEWFNLEKTFGYDWRSGKLNPCFCNALEEEESKMSLLPHLFMVAITLDSDGEQIENKGCSFNINVSRKWNRPAEFPTINQAFSGRKNRYVYANTTTGGNRRRPLLPHFPFDSVAKLNLADGSVVTWSVGDNHGFVGEPIFVPRGKGDEEDDGYIVAVEYAVSKKMCYLVILDARCLGEVVAKIEIPKHLTFPLGFHGFWAEK